MRSPFSSDLRLLAAQPGGDRPDPARLELWRLLLLLALLAGLLVLLWLVPIPTPGFLPHWLTHTPAWVKPLGAAILVGRWLWRVDEWERKQAHKALESEDVSERESEARRGRLGLGRR